METPVCTSSSLFPSASLCHSVKNPHARGLLLKKKTLKIASHHDMQEYQWELNMKAWRTKREEELQEKEANIKCKSFFFPPELQCFCLWGRFYR